DFINNTYEFGAFDSDNLGLEHYRYRIESELPQSINDIKIIIPHSSEQHIIDFIDLCSKPNANCQVQRVNDFMTDIYFYSNATIHPIISVQPLPSVDIDISPITNNKFILGISSNNSLIAFIYYTNGTLINQRLMKQNVGATGRIEVSRVNSSAVSVVMYDSITKNISLQILDFNLNNISQEINQENVNVITAFESFTRNNILAICHIDDTSNDGDIAVYNLTTYAQILDLTLDSSLSPASVLASLVGCSPFSDTRFAITFFDDGSNINFFEIWDINGTEILNRLNYDISVGETSNVDLVVINDSLISVAWTDVGGSDFVKYAIYDTAGTLIYLNSSVETLTNTINSRVSLTLIKNTTNSKNDILLAYNDFPDNYIKAIIYNEQGTILNNYTLATDVNSTYPNIKITSLEDINGIGLENNTFALAYTNRTGVTKVITFFRNGTISSGLPVLPESLSLTLISPLNDTLTNGASNNFIANFTDETSLKNATLFIKNSTNSIINQQTLSISGLTNSTNISYTFLTQGVYHWYYIVYDATHNSAQSENRKITIDLVSPTTSYVHNTELNNSLILGDGIDVNVSINDLSTTNTTIYLYNITNVTINLKETFFSTSQNNVYHKFNNLSNGIYYFNVTTCDIFSSCSSLQTRQVFVGTAQNVDMVVYLTHYPYIDVNTTLDISVDLTASGVTIPFEDVTMNITELNGTHTIFSLNYNPTTERYEGSVIFNEVGDFPFIIFADLDDGFDRTATGTMLVREAFEVAIRLIDRKTLDNIENDYAVITAEFVDGRYIVPEFERYLHPFKSSDFYENSFHAPYINGEATLTLYEPTNYLFRYYVGNVEFSAEYSKPNVTDSSFRDKIYIGERNLIGNDTLLQFLMTEKEQNPYGWLANVLLIIGLILIGLISVGLFFVIPEKPQIALIFGFLFTFILIIIRIGYWFWQVF
ncbi:MAG: hypothetical protein MUO21_12300, partial [Nitrososphaeraceae archaeon]|nr:hypothetical protein [Nitrososphaeraceae archaeon]